MGGRSTGRRRAGVALLGVVALMGVLAGCSDDASTRAGASGTVGDDGPTTTVAQVTIPKEIPEGTTLRVGDQLEYLQTVLSLAGEDDDFPYEVKYSSFVGGPPMLQAFQGGAIDSGFVASTPLIFAQAGGQDIRAIAGWSSELGSYGVLTDPAKSGIRGWEDLKGKRVATQKGTAGEAALLQNLDNVGLSADDVTIVDLPQTQATAALQGGSADAALSIEPLTSVYTSKNPEATIVATDQELPDRSQFVIATREALDDPGKSAALADYIQRLVRSFRYVSEHPDELAQAVFVDTYGLPPARAKEVVDDNGELEFFQLPGPILEPQQRLADLFAEAGSITAKVDVSKEFDTRYNDIVAEAVGS